MRERMSFPAPRIGTSGSGALSATKALRSHQHRPDIPTAVALVVAGLVLLACGGEALVRAATTIAGIAGVSPAVIGLTVVAVGTSLPELVVSVLAVARGEPDVDVANVVGSNLFNIAATLGLTAIEWTESPNGIRHRGATRTRSRSDERGDRQRVRCARRRAGHPAQSRVAPGRHPGAIRIADIPPSR